LKLGNKTTAKTASITKEWGDMVLFCNYKTLSIAADDKGSKFKGQGGKRVIYTTHHPAWDAKNRFSLPDEMDMSFAGLAHIFAPKNPLPAQQSVMEPQVQENHQELQSEPQVQSINDSSVDYT
ncbi:AAA family ATPase, partial [Proteus mirabilis]